VPRKAWEEVPRKALEEAWQDPARMFVWSFVSTLTWEVPHKALVEARNLDMELAA